MGFVPETPDKTTPDKTEGIAVSRLLRALEKVGLVEMDGRGNADGAAAGSAAPAIETVEGGDVGDAASWNQLRGEATAPVADAGPASGATAPTPGRPLDDIYSEAGITPSPFPAEKLLRIMDGLAALDPASRRAAVLALDAADEAWTIDDALLDAERKQRALQGAAAALQEQARAVLEQAREDIQARHLAQQEAVARIRQQIADLEGLMEREVARASEEKAALQADARASREACDRECARFAEEEQRLTALGKVFSNTPENVTSATPD